MVGGSSLGRALPRQRAFGLGGADGLRAHSFGALQGDQVALLQAEYGAGIGRLRSGRFDNGLHAIVFVDAGRAWTDPRHRWDVAGQRFAVDGGFGLATAEDRLRVYFAKDLQDPDSDFVVSARLRRPF
jgi:hemolysin activation/secretion protein